MTTFSLLITHSPTNSGEPYAAWRFASSALRLGHDISGIFFYGEGVHNASSLAVLPSDEVNLHRAWKDLHNEYKVPLYTCISAANRRGVLSEHEARDAGLIHHNVDTPFIVSGLGEFFSLLHSSDRMVQF
ncbi:sulfurtransferase complex subunit TusD [Aestuariibacter salexigens]|uniref:sulfurtransferase complex subunit TusD n=1 Tax=Aestuariibacter salexigens TaxID=226010 RepID=UPI00042259CC|nr:sulfurtransferase complex subunit TusD [Aestuariibacter salexigens]